MKKIPLWLTITLGAHFAFVQTASADELNKVSEEILKWIPETAKNLIVVNPPITYYRENEQPIDPESHFEFMTLGYLLCSPFGVDGGNVRRIKPAEIIQTAYLDMRKGSKERDFCAIALLKANTGRDRKMINTLREHAKSHTDCSGIQIFGLSDDTYDRQDVPTIYEAIPAPGVLICGSSIECLSEILQNRKARTGIRKTGVEWTGLVLNSSYWGLRHFNDDEKSRLGDMDADGFNFSYNKHTKRLSLKFFTKSNSIKDKYLRELLESGANKSSPEQAIEVNGIKVFGWTYPATQPKGWHIPINGKLHFPIAGLAELVEKLKKEESSINLSP